VAIELLKRRGLAGIESALFHGNGPTAEKALEATQSVTRMVACNTDAVRTPISREEQT
jgi:hypothetical protein